MKNLKQLSILSICTGALLLSGCVTREQADAKLEKACIAAAEAFIEEGYKVEEVKERIFGDDAKLGKGYREVRLTVLEGDGWYSTDKEYRCVFVEETGMFNSTHNASIYRLKIDTMTLGQEDGKLIGTIKQHQKLGDAVQKALGQ